MTKQSKEGVCVCGVSVPEFMFVCLSVCLSVPAVASASLSYVNTFRIVKVIVRFEKYDHSTNVPETCFLHVYEILLHIVLFLLHV